MAVLGNPVVVHNHPGHSFDLVVVVRHNTTQVVAGRCYSKANERSARLPITSGPSPNLLAGRRTCHKQKEDNEQPALTAAQLCIYLGVDTVVIAGIAGVAGRRSNL